MPTTATFEEQIRECFGRVVYTHKTHEKMAEQVAARLNLYSKTLIVLTGLTSTGAVGVFLTDEIGVKYVTAILSFLTLFVSTYLKNFDLGGIAQKHRDAAAKMWNIRECYLSLLTDLPKMSQEAAKARRDELQEALSAIYLAAPQTDSKAYAASQRALKYNEEFTFSTKEIDCFLPLSLRRAGADDPSQ
jgi:hypothetical protein